MQERRRARLLRDEIYDVTAWSLPLMFNVDTDTCGKAVSAKTIQLNATDKLVGSVANLDADVAYLVPWGDMASVHFLTQALQQGLIVKSADKAFILDSKQAFPAGSLIVETRRNGEDLAAKVQQIAADTGAVVTGVDSSWVINGPSFGSGDVVDMPALNIAMAWDEPVSSLSAGNSRFVIEQQLNYPVTAIRTDKLGSGNLAHYQVLILPSGRYGQAFSKAALDNIKQWISNGGVLITFGDATAFAASANASLLDVKRELAVTDKEKSKTTTSNQVKGQLLTDKQALLDASVDAKQQPDYVAGILANIEVDQEHWLTAGVNPNVVAMVTGRNIYTPITLTSGKNLAWFAGKESLLASGYLWEENTKQLAYKPFLIVQPQGNGMVIGYTQEPTTRAYLDGLNIMLANTIFRAAAHAQPLR
ncbi:MAG: hypothetical protein ABJH28_09360 [Paraglaciecola sp.]|uniref:hypothetical protein n=1 Tax=Paraglaciecola sp. TaxID=1920173 RepID=UPI00329903D7